MGQKVSSGFLSFTLWLFSLAFHLTNVPSANAQYVPYKHWTTEDRLSNNWVSAILEDRNGFLWIGTQYGVNKFDGYEVVKHYRYDPDDTNSLASNWVRSIAEDKQGHLWFGLYGGGVVRFNPYTEQFDRNIEGLPDNEAYKVFVSKNGTVWVATGKGVAFCPKGATLKFELTLSVPTYDIHEDGFGVLWFATKEGLYYKRPGSPEISLLNEVACQEVFSVSSDQERRLWVATAEGIRLYEKQAGNWQPVSSLLPSKEGANSHFFPFAFVGSDEKVWAGTGESGSLYIKHGRSKSFEKIESLPGQNIHCIAEGRNGIWIGTDRGFLRVPPGYEKFQQGAPLSILQNRPRVREILQRGKEYWYAAPDTLYRLDEKSNRVILPGSFNSLLLSSSDILYAGPSDTSGIYRIDPGSTSIGFIKFPSNANGFKPGRKVWAMAEDQSGRVWVASRCLYLFDTSRQVLTPIFRCEDGEPGDLFIDLKIDREGHLWAGTLKNGLFQIRSPHRIDSSSGIRADSIFNYTYDEGDPSTISSNLIEAIYPAADGKIWIGTDAGLNRYDPAAPEQGFTRYLQDDGLLDEKILAIEGDASGRIWMSTAGHGIFCLDTNVPDGKGAFRHFGKHDGLVSNDFLLSSVCRLDDGTLLFGSENGLQAFHPDMATDTAYVEASLFFTDYNAFGADTVAGKPMFPKDSSAINFVKNITIWPGARIPTLQFAAVGFLPEDNVRYAYRLYCRDGEKGVFKGLGPGRKISLAQLRPGNYTLEVEARHENLPNGRIRNFMHLDVEPQWYQTKVAKAAGLFLLALVLFLWFRYREKRKLAAAEARRLREKGEWYKYITTEFSDPLTVIMAIAQEKTAGIYPELDKKMEAIKRNGRLLQHLVNQLLDLTQIGTNRPSVKKEQGDIIRFFRFLAEPFQSYAREKGVSLHFISEMEEYHMKYDSDKVLKVISNLLSNAIKFTPPDGDIFFQVGAIKQNGASFLKVVVRDTGMGIPPEKLPHIFDCFHNGGRSNSGRRKGEGAGIGLTITRALVELMDGSIKASSGQVGEGAAFSLLLPASKNGRVQAPKDYINELWDKVQFYVEELTTMAPEQKSTSDPFSDRKPSILIIEDNQDVYQVLESFLRPCYAIEYASDGQIGIEKALKGTPDIIISDVDMPEKDGFEVCETLKNDERTSHIPIILLSGRADDAAETESLEKLADAFLLKPFDKEKVKAQLKNLLELRKKIQEHIRKQLSGAGSEGNMEKVDDPWLSKTIAVIDAHMGDKDFDVSPLAEKMGMNRNQLFLKIRALTGASPRQLILSRRLKKAKWLVTTTDRKLQDIAYEVGFSGPAHFSREFKKKFRMPPIKMRKKERKQTDR